jgi:3-hydroxyacyl-[acyl-carrier-protein] dehydratase
MKFGLIDRIVELTRGERIVAVKAVSLAEEYLADHFPTFPVLPGVLMLEGMGEAAAWLVRDARDFRETVILLRRARNVTYKSFVKPGNLVVYTVTCRRLTPGQSDFEGIGHCNQQEVLKARFSLAHFFVGGSDGSPTQADQRVADAARARFVQLRR